MPSSHHDVRTSLAAARAGSREALGRLFEGYRNYLLLIADRELDPELRAKGGASDLVQETFLEAQRDFDGFQGDTEGEFLAWLKKLLRNNLVNFARRYRTTAKRQIDREVSLEAGASPAHSPGGLCAPTPAPADPVLAAEQAQRVREALAGLSDEHRLVLELRCGDDCSFEEIGQRMNRSKNAAQKLWMRAVERLQQALASDAEG